MFLIFTSLPSVVPHLFNASNVSIKPFFPACKLSLGFRIIYTTYAFANMLLLSLYIFILVMGFQRCRRRLSAAAGATISHSDFFTYQMMIIGIVDVFGSVFISLGDHLESKTIFRMGVFLLGFVIPGQTFFHVLTCVERYVAVVHAIAYMHLRETVKVRVRNISTGAVWLLCFTLSGLIKVYLPNFPTDVLMVCLAVCLVVTSFCCLSVLHFLRRPRPGDVSGNQQRTDQSKKRAFNMILAITVTLALRMLGILLCVGVKHLIVVDVEYLCALMDAGVWLIVPSNLVLPLLFLHRAGKLLFLQEKCRMGLKQNLQGQ